MQNGQIQPLRIPFNVSQDLQVQAEHNFYFIQLQYEDLIFKNILINQDDSFFYCKQNFLMLCGVFYKKNIGDFKKIIVCSEVQIKANLEINLKIFEKVYKIESGTKFYVPFNYTK